VIFASLRIDMLTAETVSGRKLSIYSLLANERNTFYEFEKVTIWDHQVSH